MEIKDSLKDDIDLYFSNKFPEKPECPLCHSHTWALSSIIGSIKEYKPPKGLSGDFPLILMVCEDCGYVITISYVYVKEFVERIKQSETKQVDKK